MPEMHLRVPGSTYSACGPFTKSKERVQKFKFKIYHKIGLVSMVYKYFDKKCSGGVIAQNLDLAEEMP